MTDKIEVYGTERCPHCIRIKDFLDERRLPYEVKLTKHSDPKRKRTIEQKENRQKLIDLGLETIPQIFINGKLIGGADKTIQHINTTEDTDDFFAEFNEEEDKIVEQLNLPSDKTYRDLVKIPEIQEGVASTLTHIQNICHGLAREGGWWDRKGDALAAHNLLLSGEPQSEAAAAILRRVANQERNPLELLALIHSEASEALEGVRKNQMDDKLPHRKMEEVELADIIVRVLDYAGGRGLDVGGALIEKLIFNITREDHQIENRLKSDGKKY